MDNIQEQWILPVFYEKDEQGERDTIGGQSFVVGTCLITAAHVIVDAYRPYIILAGERLYLMKENTIAYSFTPNTDNLGDYEDYAIFLLSNELKSPLSFSKIENKSNWLCKYRRKVQHENMEICESNIFSTKAKKQKSYVKTHLFTSLATFDNIISPKLFQCKVSPVLAKGDSGCPIVTTDNQIIGFLIGAREENLDIHLFQSAAFIKKILEQCLAN